MRKTALVTVLAAVPPLSWGPAAAAATQHSTLSEVRVAAAGLAAVHCHSSHGLPDRRCAPGAAYPKVTQRNIGRTSCRSGWTSTVRPAESYTAKLKRQQIAEYGYRDKQLADYEEDHLIPLEIGGSPRSVKNLWPEYDAGKIPNPTDKVENALHRAVCEQPGRATIASGISGATRGYRVVVSVTVAQSSKTANCPTSFTPA